MLLIHLLLKLGKERGGVVIFSSGNEGSTSLSNEAALKNVISVGAIEADGSRSMYSNYGLKLDLVAPSNFVSIDLVGEAGFEATEMGFIAGTSFSAPIVAGVVALMLEVNPDLTTHEIKSILYSTTKKIGDADSEFHNDKLGYDYQYDIDLSTNYNTYYPKSREVGYGLVDAQKSVDKAKQYKLEKDNTSDKPDQIGLLDNITQGWNFLGTEETIVDLSLFDSVSIVWCYINGNWQGYSANLEYARSLRKQNKLLAAIPEHSGIWVYLQ